DDEVRLTQLLRQLPDTTIRPLDRGWHVGSLPLRHPAVHPPHEGGDLSVAQRDVVPELPHADRLIDVPGRHHPRFDLLLDHVPPGADLLEGDQRHGTDRAGPMTALTVLLE